MKKAILCCIGLFAISGCSNQPAPATEKYLNPYALQESFLNRLTKPVTGFFYVTYIPANFAEPEDLRVARDRYIKARIIMALERAGLTYTDDLRQADYEVTYDYSTGPSSYMEPNGSMSTGYNQDFYIAIDYNPTKLGYRGGLKPEDILAWSGRGWIADWSDSDPTTLFDRFIAALLDKFPKDGDQVE